MSIIDFENETIRVRFLDGHRKGPRFPKDLDGNEAYVKVPNRRIEAAIFHHSAGGFFSGIKAVDRLADFCIAPPKYKVDQGGQLVLSKTGKRILVGGGRGWPGIPYTYVIPAYPETEEGRLVVFKIWHDDWVTWHTGGVHNRHAVGICVGGWYASKHDLLTGELNGPAHERPSGEAMAAADALADHLMVRHSLRLGPDTLLCHAELGKPACPGSALENWVREKRGEDPIIDVLPALEDQRPLEKTRQVQLALVELGYDPGTVDGAMGPFTMTAIRGFQRAEQIRPDGIFGPITRQAMRIALAREAAMKSGG